MVTRPTVGGDAGTWGTELNEYLVAETNVEGMTGDGTTDNSTPVAAAFSSAALGADGDQTYFDDNWRGRKVIRIGPGTYKITSPGALMSDLGIERTTGLTIRGAGRDMTNIVFSPGTANQYLMDNNDDWLHVTFEDMTFHSTVSTASFMKSTSSGGAQNYVFNRVNWSGTWKYGIELLGTNNNSEYSFFHCGIYADWTAFLFVAASGTSDQFLNYNFFACNVEYLAGNFIDMAMGGNINVWGGSLIHGGGGGSNQTFFKLRGGDHASGVQRLFVCGARIEHRHTNSVLIDSEWKRGNITFLSVDTEPNASVTGNDTAVKAIFSGSNSTLPSIEWIGCSLIGKHSYQFEVNSWDDARRINYRDCEIYHHTSAHDFITIVNNGGTGNVGGTPPIRFEGCRGLGSATDTALYPFDCTVSGLLTRNVALREHRVSIKKPNGGMPIVADPTEDCWLPLNAIVTNVRFYKPAGGASGSTTWTYTVKTSEGSPTTLATANPGTAWSSGYNVNTDTWFVCDSDAKRHLTLNATVITESASNQLCIVTYLA